MLALAEKYLELNDECNLDEEDEQENENEMEVTLSEYNKLIQNLLF
jgi:hypothetical protein